MPATWYTSDSHFGHLKLAVKRGFETTAEHDAELIRRWNKIVGPDDMVWHLGDFALAPEEYALQVAARLNGQLQMVTGNHDRPWPGNRNGWKHQRAWLTVFESVQQYAWTRIGGREVMMSHFPYSGDNTHARRPGDPDRHTRFRLRNNHLPLLHGHTHDPGRIAGIGCVHVGMDAWGLRPAGLGEVTQLLEESFSGVAA